MPDSQSSHHSPHTAIIQHWRMLRHGNLGQCSIRFCPWALHCGCPELHSAEGSPQILCVACWHMTNKLTKPKNQIKTEDQCIEYNRASWDHHSTVKHLFGDKQTFNSQETLRETPSYSSADDTVTAASTNSREHQAESKIDSLQFHDLTENFNEIKITRRILSTSLSNLTLKIPFP